MKIKFSPDFNTALGIAEKYSLDTEEITRVLDELPNFRVTAPVIGGFSTGKSSLINAVLGEKLLSTNITPETAVPTEIICGNDTATLVSADGSENTIPLAEFDHEVLSAAKYSVVKIATSNELFSRIPTIKLVDMPGFDSGIDVHNKAIDNYLPQSLAYILTVASDEGTLRASIISFLNEYKLYDLPMYTVITKASKTDQETVEQLKAHISETLRRFLNVDEPKIAVTSAKGDVDVEGFRDFLLELQSNSDDIYNKYFSGKLSRSCLVIERYLAECLNNDDLTWDDLKAQKEQAERAFEDVNKKFDEEKRRFNEQLEKCISSISTKINTDLNALSNTIESFVIQGNEGAIRDKINLVVRNAYTVVIQTELEPKIRRYISNVEKSIQVDVYDAKAEIPEFDQQIDDEVKNILNDVVQKLIPVITSTIGTAIGTAAGASGAVAGAAAGAAAGTSIAPVIGTVIGLAAGAIAGILINVGINVKQKVQRENLAREKTHELINSAVQDASAKVAEAIYQYSDKIDEILAEKIEKERELKAKIIDDCEKKLHDKEDERARITADIKTDLETIRSILNGKR